MSESFDPYYRWLGIPPSHQPPDHYTLLGLHRFEANGDVISNAVDRQMSHVRSFRTGPNKEHCERILNEISAAQGCLLNPRKKAEYDKELRSKLPAAEREASAKPAAESETPKSKKQLAPPSQASPASAAKAPVRPLASPSDELFSLADAAPVEEQYSSSRYLLDSAAQQADKQRRAELIKMFTHVGIALAGLLAAVVLISFAYDAVTTMMSEKPDKPPVVEETDEEEPEEVVVPSEQTPRVAMSDDRPLSEPRQWRAIEFELSSLSSAPPPETETAPQKRQAPDAEALSNLLESLEAEFAELLADSGTEEKKKAISVQLRFAATQRQSNPAETFALLWLACRFAAGGDDLTEVREILDQLQARFAFDKTPLHQEILEQLKAKGIQPQYAEMAADFVSEAAADGRYEAAEELNETAKTFATRLANKSGFREQGTELRRKGARLTETIARKRAVEAKRASIIERARLNPFDKPANRELGLALCIEDGNWDEGLPYLAKAGEDRLAIAARHDLDGAESAENQFKLAKEWREIETPGFRARAAYWYERIVGEQHSAIDIVTAQQALDELYNQGMPDFLFEQWRGAGELGVAALSHHSRAVSSLDVSPDGSKVVSGARDGRVNICDITSLRVITTIQAHHGPVWDAEFFQRGGGPLQLATCGQDECIRFWNPDTGELTATMTGHNSAVHGLSFSRNNALMASVGCDGLVKIWVTATATENRSSPALGQPLLIVQFTERDATLTFAGASGNIGRWILSASEVAAPLTSGHEGYIADLASSPLGDIFASAGPGLGGSNHVINFWNLSAASVSSDCRGHAGAITDISLSPDGSALLSASLDGTMRVWTVNDRKSETISEAALAVEFLADGESFVSGGRDGKVRLWSRAPVASSTAE